jgi:hypothetical protein
MCFSSVGMGLQRSLAVVQWVLVLGGLEAKNYEHNAPGGFCIRLVWSLIRAGFINIVPFLYTLMWPGFGFFPYL